MKTAYTIVTSNYLAQAKTVADSFIAHNPDYDFIICLLDKVKDGINVGDFEPHEVLEVESLRISFFTEMYERYDMFELSNAMKPYFAEFLYKRDNSVNTLIYLDSDMMVFNSFQVVEECLKEYAICFTPHIFSTIPKDDFLPNESSFLNSGIFNGGFFALAIEEESKRFIEWWKEKLRYYCFHNVCEGLFVDQIWLNLVPLFFDKVFILKDPGYNMAYYNLHERSITFADDMFFVNGKHPLTLYHFTGYDINNPQEISKYQSRFDFEYRSDIRPVYKLYYEELEKNNHVYFSKLVPFYKKLRDARLSRDEVSKIETEQKRKVELEALINNKLEQTLPGVISKTIEQQTFYGKLSRLKKRFIK